MIGSATESREPAEPDDEWTIYEIRLPVEGAPDKPEVYRLTVYDDPDLMDTLEYEQLGFDYTLVEMWMPLDVLIRLGEAAARAKIEAEARQNRSD